MKVAIQNKPIEKCKIIGYITLYNNIIILPAYLKLVDEFSIECKKKFLFTSYIWFRQ